MLKTQAERMRDNVLTLLSNYNECALQAELRGEDALAIEIRALIVRLRASHEEFVKGTDYAIKETS